ncbi:MAG: hypothetical protein IH991_17930, partial [Planctomycetes bacterium]|nr:hypothetical protein [Planctomycetota bacterium]
MRARLLLYTIALFSAAFASTANAADVYYVKPLSKLSFDGEKPNASWNDYWRWSDITDQRILLDGGGEAYLVLFANEGEPKTKLRGAYVAMRLAKAREIRGRLRLPNPEEKGLKTYRFSIRADEGKSSDPREFLLTKRAHYLRAWESDIPGAFWFRHQVQTIDRELGIKNPPNVGRRRFFGTFRSNDWEDTFALLSGGRAVSENLQLDRILPTTRVDMLTVALDSLKGITVKEFDWAALTKGIDPKLDPLASLIPDDQHALFFSSYVSLAALASEAAAQGGSVLEVGEPRAESAYVRQRYRRQLCLSLEGAAQRILGPRLINTVALTGGDPYLRTGADVAVLFEPKTTTEALLRALQAQVLLAAAKHDDVKTVSDTMDGVDYTSVRTPDRSVCSYVAAVKDTVVVTNSPAQLKRLIAISKSPKESLAALPEYKYFRNRYPMGDANESALLVISDKTIRRWCGPRWRIASSRRTRAAAVTGELQAERLDQLVTGKAEPGLIVSKRPLPDAGRFRLTPSGVNSTVYGTLAFQTPIIELKFDRVTQQEADFYKRWRDGYQRNWSGFFDPIAVSFYVGKDRLAGDLTVMPLIDNSRYRELATVSQGVGLKLTSGDPHKEALVHWIQSLNPTSLRQQWHGWLDDIEKELGVSVTDWLGDNMAIYTDVDAFWADMFMTDDPGEYFEKNLDRLPVAVYVKAKNERKLTEFVAAIGKAIERHEPNFRREWKTKKHKGRVYVQIPLSRVLGAGSNLSLYYVTLGDELTMTLNEKMLKRAIDRGIAVAEGKPAEEPAIRQAGQSIHVHIDERFKRSLVAIYSKQHQEQMQQLAWNNLPILNEWKRLYPERSPTELHDMLWHRKLLCPGGGEYRWNKGWQTMESTVYGHPAEPKEGAPMPRIFEAIKDATFGLTFEP